MSIAKGVGEAISTRAPVGVVGIDDRRVTIAGQVAQARFRRPQVLRQDRLVAHVRIEDPNTDEGSATGSDACR